MEWGWCDLGCVWFRTGWVRSELTLVRCACHSFPCIAPPPLRSIYSVIFPCRGAVGVALVAFTPPPSVSARLLPVVALSFRCASLCVLCVVSVWKSSLTLYIPFYSNNFTFLPGSFAELLLECFLHESSVLSRHRVQISTRSSEKLTGISCWWNKPGW